MARSEHQKLLHRQQIAELYLRGYTQQQIAARLAISQPTVSRDLKAIHQEWLNSALTDFNEIKLRELARIDQLEREYWEAWERSRQPKQRTTRRAGDDERVTTEERSGNPAFLTGVEKCIKMRADILGIIVQRSDSDTRMKLVVEWSDDVL